MSNNIEGKIVVITGAASSGLGEAAARYLHAEDCADCRSQQGTIGEITREIAIGGAISDDERSRLLAIADRCPVHMTLTHEIKIRTRLVRR